MKKFLVTVLGWMITLQLSAQLPTGAYAPDFVLTDLQGKQHRLYDILDDNKVVVLQFMSTNSQVCWGYHQTKTMNELYETHGPGNTTGEVEIEILFIESDPNTSPVCLTQGCSTSNFASWTTGIDYPMANDTNICKLYQVDNWPRFYVICPDRRVTLIGTYNNNEILKLAKSCPRQKGSINGGLFDFKTGIPFKELCATLTSKPTVRLVNTGATPLTSALLYLSWEGQTVETKNWTGNLSTFESELIEFEPVNLNGSGDIRITAVINGDEYEQDNIVQQSFVKAPEVEFSNLLLRIRTDAYGPETYWEVKSFEGNVIDFGGNQAVGPDGGGGFPSGIAGGPGAYHDEAIIRDTIKLPGCGCYVFKIVDAFGDGICCGGTVQGFFKLYSGPTQNSPLIINGGEFKTEELHAFGLCPPNEIIGTKEETPKPPHVDVLPNPVSDQFMVTVEHLTKSKAIATVHDLYGQLIWSLTEREYYDQETITIKIDSAAWAAGWYTFNWLESDGRQTTVKFLVVK